MTTPVRATIGIIAIALGWAGVIIGLSQRKVLWSGVKTETKTVYVIKEIPEPRDNWRQTGVMTVQYRSNSSSYQLRNDQNMIWIIRFCEPAPVFEEGDVVNITYVNDLALTCKWLVYAQMIKEHK